jgi:hypothetical protein
MCKKTDAVLRFLDCEDMEIPEFFESLWDFICVPDNQRNPKDFGYITGSREERYVWETKDGLYSSVQCLFLKNPEQGTGRVIKILKGSWFIEFAHHTNDGKYKVILPVTRAEFFQKES